MTSLFPVGNRIIVRKIQDETRTKSGIILAEMSNPGINVWGEIISLPQETSNPSIKAMEIGGKVLYRRFDADKGRRSEDDDFEVVEVEPQNGSRMGQVLAYEPPKEENVMPGTNANISV